MNDTVPPRTVAEVEPLYLGSLVTHDNCGLKVHMASPDPADPLAFDYKLKPGINTASSAEAILRLIGIET